MIERIKQKYCVDKRIIPRTAEEIYNRGKQIQKTPAFENATGSSIMRLGKVLSANRELMNSENSVIWNRIMKLKEEIRKLEPELKKKKEELAKLEKEDNARRLSILKKK